ncbi:MAG: serine/threonine-protein kinase [Deltaproteobacteria bacterium]|nr:serine/threonine-protein kinase [Deltaproteobacteria bacterium]
MTSPPDQDLATLSDQLAAVRNDGDPVDRQAVLASVQRGLFADADDPLRVGRFVVIERLGTGASGVVYAAYDPQLDRKIALKLLRPDADLGDQAHARLHREAQALAKLSHPHVVAVHDVGDLEGRVFIAMELLTGGTLRHWSEARDRTREEVMAVFLQAGDGLAAAHEAGLVHRDFKPDNVLLDERGGARVVDFGLAREQPDTVLLPHDAIATGEVPRTELETRLTQTGAMLGTPAYMAPEQFAGSQTDARTDQYAFCVSLYEALYGERPFDGDTLAALAVSASQARIRPTPPGRAVPTWLRRALVRGLHPDPAHRYPHMGALLSALRRDPWARWRRRGLVLLGLGAAVGLTWTAAQRDPVDAASPASCSGFQRRIDAIWQQPQRDKVERALDRSTHPGAAATWARIGPRLDTYADAWVQARKTACEAREVRREVSAEVLDRRVRCLDRAVLALGASVERLQEADRETVARAASLVPDRVLIDECSQEGVLDDGDAPPVDPDQRAQVQRVEAELADITSLRLAGRYLEAEERAAALAKRSDSVEHAPTRARIQLALAATQVHGRQPADAEQAFVRAIAEAERGHADRTRAEAMRALVKRIAETGRFAEAERLATLTDGIHARLAHPQVGSETRLHLIWGNLHWLRSNYDEGIEHFDSAIATSRDDDDPRVRALYTEALIHRGSIALEAGRPADALPRLRLALQVTEAQLGGDHPDIAIILSNLGGAQVRLGDHAAAQVSLERALQIREQRMGEDHESLAPTLANLGGIATTAGKPAEGLAHLERAVRLMEKRLGRDDAELAVPLHNMALAHLRLDAPQKALALVRRAVELRINGLGPEHAKTIGSVYQLAYAEQQAGNLEAAEREYRRHLQLIRTHRPDDERSQLLSLIGISDIALTLGRPGQARDVLEQAVPVLGDGPAHTQFQVAVNFNMAKALDELGRPRQAQERARTALEHSKHPAARETSRPKIEAWLRQHPGLGSG